MKQITKADRTVNGIPLNKEKMYQAWLNRLNPELKRIDIDIQRLKRLRNSFNDKFDTKYPEKINVLPQKTKNLKLKLLLNRAARETNRGGWKEFPEEFLGYTQYLQQYKDNQKYNDLWRTDMRSNPSYIPTEEPTFAQYTLTNRVRPEKTSGAYYQTMTARGNAKNISPLLSIIPRTDYLPEKIVRDWPDPNDRMPVPGKNTLFEASSQKTKSMKKKQQDYSGPMQPYVLPDMNDVTWLSHMRNRPAEMYHTAYNMRDANRQKKLPKDTSTTQNIFLDAQPKKNYSHQPLKFDFYLRYPDTVEGSNFTPRYNMYGEDFGGYMRNVRLPSSNTGRSATKRMSKRAIPTQRTDKNTNKYNI